MSARVGPILQAGRVADAVLAALRALNAEVEAIDRGAYVRVLVPGRCRLTRAAVEDALGAPFRFPADLEAIMPSFQGHLRIDEDEVSWESPGIGAVTGGVTGGSTRGLK